MTIDKYLMKPVGMVKRRIQIFVLKKRRIIGFIVTAVDRISRMRGSSTGKYTIKTFSYVLSASERDDGFS